LYVKHELKNISPYFRVVWNVLVDASGWKPLDWAWLEGLGFLYSDCDNCDEEKIRH